MLFVSAVLRLTYVIPLHTPPIRTVICLSILWLDQHYSTPTLLFVITSDHWVHMVKAKRGEWMGRQHKPHFALVQHQPIMLSHPLI